MIDKTLILQDLRDRKLTQGQIAQKYGCGRATIVRLVKKHGLQIGRGISNYWTFTASSEALAYVIGAYITDGMIGRDHRTNKPKQLVLNSSTEEFTQHIHDCLTKLDMSPRLGIHHSPTRKGRSDLFSVAGYSSMFATWLLETCQGKSKIPTFLLHAPLSHQLAFLAGAIDGDGHVTKHGSIRIRGVDEWLKELPTLLAIMGIRTSGYKTEAILQSGKSYYRVSIKRADFRALGGWCIINAKRDRILNAKDTRNR